MKDSISLSVLSNVGRLVYIFVTYVSNFFLSSFLIFNKYSVSALDSLIV